jgi:hypothetical protein
MQHIHSKITISNTFIQRSQYPTHSFKLHNIHHMHTQHNIHRQDHKSKVNTCKHRHLVVPRIAASRTSSSGVVPRIAVSRASSGVVPLKRLLRKSFAGLFEADCEGYRMSKRVDRKVQSKVKSLESEHVVVHFPPAPVSLVKEWHQMRVIPKIRKVSIISISFPLV